MPFTRIPKNSSNSFQSRYDDRKGLGYGSLEQTFQGEKKSNDDFPYLDSDDAIEDVEVNDESLEAISKKVYTPRRTDPGAEKSTDRLYFVGAASKLHACFEHPEDILEEIMAIAKDMEPRAGSASIGGYSAWKAFDERPYKRTGTKKGWSESPPMSIPAMVEDEEEEEIYNLQDFADVQSRSLGESFTLYDHT